MVGIPPRRGALLALALAAAGCGSTASGAAPARPNDAVSVAPARATAEPRAHEVPRVEAAPSAPPPEPTPPEAAPTPPPTPAPDPPAPTPVAVRVRWDKTVQALHGAPGDPRVLVYLHGVCGDVHAFRSWASAAVEHGTLIALLGDVPCKGSDRFRWGDDVSAIHRRITAAVGAVGAARGEPLNTGSLTVIGYSQGALKAEALVRRYPSIYPRALLIAGPRAPTIENLKAAGAAVLIGGARDRRDHLREAARAMEGSGKAVTYMELPEARHGEYGPQGARVMGEALRWVFEKAP